MCSRLGIWPAVGILLLGLAGCRDLVVPNEMVDGERAPVVRGIVFGPDGAPLANARVDVDNWRYTPNDAPAEVEIDWAGHTDELGMFDTGRLSRGLPVDVSVNPLEAELPNWFEHGMVPEGGSIEFRYPAYRLSGQFSLLLEGQPEALRDPRVEVLFSYDGRYRNLGVRAAPDGSYRIAMPDVEDAEVTFVGGWGESESYLVDYLVTGAMGDDRVFDAEFELDRHLVEFRLGGSAYPAQEIGYWVRLYEGELRRNVGGRGLPGAGELVIWGPPSGRGEAYFYPTSTSNHLPLMVLFDPGAGQVPGQVQMGAHRLDLSLLDPEGNVPGAARVEVIDASLNSYGGDLGYGPAAVNSYYLNPGQYILEASASGAEGALWLEMTGDISRTLQLRPR